METIEKTILRQLIHDEDFLRQVLPFIKEEYFTNQEERILFRKINDFVQKYNNCPTIASLDIACQNDKTITEKQYGELQDYFDDYLRQRKEKPKLEWLLDQTEKFCKDKAVYNAIMRSIKIIDGSEKTLQEDAIPALLQDALSISFDKSIGHDYFEDAESRWEFYTRKENKLKFDIDYLNKITNGGLTKKTLNILMASTGVGKSLVMCHMAANWIAQGLNVLYITLEMAEEKIAQRIDANMLDIDINKIELLPKESFNNRIQKILKKTTGKLVVKEYPTSTAHANHFRALINDLHLKKNFKPDIIFIDYLNICASARYKPSQNTNSYIIVKSIAEEVRGLAVEFDVPIISATQTNRAGYDNSDIGMTETSESIGLPMSVDLFLALISNDQLEELNQIMIKQLKNRYGPIDKYRKFVVGIDRPKMRLYNLEESAQESISDSGNEEAKKMVVERISARQKSMGGLASIKV
jgi:replicative DNA helicase